jgi:hypothetical protein
MPCFLFVLEICECVIRVSLNYITFEMVWIKVALISEAIVEYKVRTRGTRIFPVSS